MKPYHHFSQSVAFQDIDLVGVLYHGKYLDYFDRARQSMLDEIDCPFAQLIGAGIAIVVVDASVRFSRPVQFGAEINIYSRVIRRRSKTFVVEQKLTTSKEPVKNPETHRNWNAKASIVLACMDMSSKRATMIPQILLPLFPQ